MLVTRFSGTVGPPVTVRETLQREAAAWRRPDPSEDQEEQS